MIRVRERLGAEVVDGLVRDYRPGWSLKLLGERYDISKASVLKVLGEAGVPNRKSSVNHDYLPAQAQRIWP